jgi:hypothetical protein
MDIKVVSFDFITQQPRPKKSQETKSLSPASQEEKKSNKTIFDWFSKK